MFYSAQKRGFYDKEIHGDNMPSDVVEISNAYHQELMEGQNSGRIISPDEKGFPRLTDRPLPTQEEIKLQKNAEMRAYLNSTDWYVVRQAETGEAIPQEILDARAAARLSIVE